MDRKVVCILKDNGELFDSSGGMFIINVNGWVGLTWHDVDESSGSSNPLAPSNPSNDLIKMNLVTRYTKIDDLVKLKKAGLI